MDSTKKGASAKQANTWFIDGTELIGEDITEFEGGLRVLGLTQLKGVIKNAPVPAQALSKGPPSDGQVRKFVYPCGNCGGDHDKRACQHKDECLPCKTKLHAY